MLKLRRGVVVEDDPLTVQIGGERRRAWADPALVGECHAGDEVVVNTQALDLGLGSGGFDIVHVNLTRGMDGGERGGADEGGGANEGGDPHVMKLNYTSLQHAIDPVECDHSAPPLPQRRPPVLVLPLHGHLAPATWALSEAARDVGVGYVQVGGGALPGGFSRDVAELRSRGLLAGSVAVAPCYGGEHEAISAIGALHAGAERLGWEAIVVGPGPGILGSATRYGHGGMAAVEAAHAALALDLPTLLSPRLSGSDPRPRHRGLSHHTAAVLGLLLRGVSVAAPETDVGGWPTGAAGGADAPDALAALTEACGDRHDVAVAPIDLDRYSASGLPTRTMGRDLADDPLFFAAPLAAGGALARMLSKESR